MINWADWETHKIGGRRFLVLHEKGGRHVAVFGPEFANYGSYYDWKNFKDMYAREGEALNLSPVEEVV